MISVLVNWLYIGITTFFLGYGVKKGIEKLLGYSMKQVNSIVMSGLIVATVYAQVFSFFGRVGLWANLILVLMTVLVYVFLNKEIRVYLKEIRKKECRLYYVIVFCLVIVWSYLTSRGYIMYDTDLYHAQSIRWIEEYGVVKGLGNLHERFAYNSGIFPLSALYSMKFLIGQSLHTVNGFFALLLSVLCMDVGKAFLKRKLKWSDFARVPAIYYLTMIADEVIGPTSDYCIMCVIFYIIIKWLDELEKETKDITPYALLCVVGVYALTLKLTAGLILILVFKPAYMLLHKKKWKEIGIFLGMGILVCAPWMIRTIIISGYLLYPFPQLDLFSFDWKMTAERVEWDALCIKVWGRGFQDVAMIKLPVREWFPVWIQSLTSMEKLLILADIFSLVVLSAELFYSILKRRWNRLDYLHVLLTVAACYIFWQLSAPLVRYGYAYILLLAALTGSSLVTGVKRDGLLRFAIIGYGCYKMLMIGQLAWNERREPFYIMQQDYEKYEVLEVTLGSEQVYIAAQGDRTGYDSFPSIPGLNGVEMRGDGFQEGFRPSSP